MKKALQYFIVIFFGILYIGCDNRHISTPTYQKQNSKKVQAILKIDPKGHTGLIKDIIVSKSGDIISASDDKTIRVWDSKTGNEKRKIQGEIGTGNEGQIFAIALSDDEKYLAVGGFMDTTNGGISVGKIKIFDYSTGKLLKVLKSHTNVVHDLAFKDNYLISGSSDNKAKLWSLKDNFALLDTIDFHTSRVCATEIIENQGRYFAVTVGLDNQIALYDIGKKTIVDSHKLPYKLKYIAINPYYKNIAVCGEAKEIKIYSYNLNLLKTIKSTTSPSALHYSPNGKYFISGAIGTPRYINIYTTSNYNLYSSFKKHTDATVAVNFLDNYTAISGGGSNYEIYIWDIKTTKVKNKIVGVGSGIWSVGIDKDIIAWGNKYNKITQNNKGLLQKSIDLKDFTIKNSALNIQNFHRISINNGRYTLSHSKGGKYGYSDAILNIKKDGKIVAKIVKNTYNGYRHRCYGWYKDFIISGGANGYLKIYNKDGKEVASLIGHTGEIFSIAVEKDRLISGSSDQSIKIWDLKKLEVTNINMRINEFLVKMIMNKYNMTRENVISIAKQKNINIYEAIPQKIHPSLTIFPTKNNGYIAYTNEGFFTASKDASKYIGYHINQGANKEAEFVTVDALYNTFYRPDLIQKTLKGESLKQYAQNINIYELLKNGLAPEVHILAKVKTTKTQDIKLKLQVCPKGKGGYDNLILSINDTPVSIVDTSRALKIKKKSKRADCFIYNQTISLIGGKNKIGFKATNKVGNIESKPDFIEVTFDDSKLKQRLKNKLSKISNNQNINNLHILTIAVNNYKDKELRLKYSLNDAKDVLETIQKVAKPLFNNIYIYKLFDKDVTKQNIKNIFSKIKSTPNDVFLLYIAGHGITDEYNGHYYYIPYDFKNIDDIKTVQTQGISQKDFMIGLSKIKALKSLILLDTCNSGSFVEANMQKTTTNRLARATGRATISASSKSQIALEGYKNHGVFTYTLLEALKGKGYQNDSKITINELNEYIKKILPNLTHKKWGYKQLPQSSMYGTDFNIGTK